MDPLLFVFWTGLVAGIVHVYVGADHLAVLMPLSVGHKARAAWQGVRWGVAHSFGVVLVAMVLLATRTSFDIMLVGVWSERFVGVMLIAFGILGIRSANRDKFHLHEHAHEDETHAHLHLHSGKESHAAIAPQPGLHMHRHAALGAGTLQGIAGMAHVMGVLPSLALPSLAESLVYLLAFAVGSIAGMAIFAATVGSITARLGKSAPGFIGVSMYVAASACLVVGIAWIVAPFLGYELL